MKSTLLLRLGGLGDLIVAFPSILLLRKKFSPCFLTLVCREEYGFILKQTGVVDEIVSAEQARLAPLFDSPPYPEELSNWLEGFSLILGWIQTKSSLNHEELSSFLSTNRCRFFVHDPDYPGQISRYFFEKILEYLTGIDDPSSSFSDCTRLPLSSSQVKLGLGLLREEPLKDKEEEAERGQKIVVVHPGSGSKSKCWPLENFMEMIHQFSRKGYRGALVTGFADVELENKLSSYSLPKNWVWLRNPSLVKLSGLLSVSSLYLGNDSGITHLAAACGTKVIALFQNDLESAWRPYGRVTILSGESVSDISPHTVLEAASRIIE